MTLFIPLMVGFRGSGPNSGTRVITQIFHHLDKVSSEMAIYPPKNYDLHFQGLRPLRQHSRDPTFRKPAMRIREWAMRKQ